MSRRKLPSENNQPDRGGAADHSSRCPAELAEFQDADRAKLALSQVGAYLSPDLANAVAGLLAEMPDPDAALILFHRLVSDSTPEVLRLI